MIEEDKEKLGKRKRQAFEDFRYDYNKAKKAKTQVDSLIVGFNNLYYGKPFGNEEKGKSNFVMKEVAKQVEWMMPNLTEPFTSSSHPVQCTMGHNQKQAKKIEKYLNIHFTSDFDRDTFLEQVGDVLFREGTVWVKSGWEFKEEIVETEVKGVSMQELMMSEDDPSELTENSDGTFNAVFKKKEMIRNRGTAKVLRNENVFPDPDARSDDELRFIAIRRYVTKSDLVESKLYSKTQIDKLESSKQSNTESDLDQTRQSENEEYGQDSNYSPNDKARQKIEIVEYWGYYDLDGDGIAEPVVCTWAVKDEVNLRIEPSPMPSKRIPIYREVYSSRPFSLWGNAPAFFIGDNQQIKTGIMRGILDNISLSNNGQKFITKGTLDYVNFKKMRNGHRHIIVNKPEGIQDGSYNQIPASTYNTLQMVDREIQQLSGTSGQGAAVDQNALNKEDEGNQITQSQQRMSKIVRGVGNLVSKVMEDWVEMADLFLTSEQIKSLFGENEPIDWLVLNGSRRSNISLRIGTEINRQRKSHNLNMLMQQSKTLAENAPPHLYNSLVAQNFELYDMYEDAEELRNYRPEPSEEQKAMQQLAIAEKQLQIEKLKAEIEESKANARAKMADSMTKGMVGESQKTLNHSKAGEADANSNQKGMDTALKPVQVQNEIEKSQEGDTRANG